MTKLNALLGGFPSAFSSPTEEERKSAAWAKAAQIFGSFDRRDCDGRVIRWSEYGKYSEFGWHLDHIIPLRLGGSDDLPNLRARHWRGNCAAGGFLAAGLGDVGR